MNTYSSKLLETAVNELSKLPGIGRKTALRLALHLLRENRDISESLGSAIIRLRNEIQYCKTCYNISDSDICEVCNNPRREHELICIIENIRDFMAIENTNQYKGVYHVLGGVISPMDGIGPEDLNIESLITRISKGNVKEVMLALPTTVEGDTTAFLIFRRLKEFPVKITTIARGISMGDELEYADELTLGRSIVNRLPYESVMGGPV